MCTNYLKTQFENNIRVMERKDVEETIKIISDGLYGLWQQNLKNCLKKNTKAQISLVAITTVLMLLLDGDFWTFIFIVLAQELLLALACVLKFYSNIGNELKELRNIELVAKNNIKFWVFDGTINNKKRIVGSVALATACDNSYDSPRTVALKRLSVTPNLRRMKIGSKMLEHAIQQATEMGFHRMVLYCGDSQMPAFALYKKYGFEISEIVDTTAFFVLSAARLFYMEKQLRRS